MKQESSLRRQIKRGKAIIAFDNLLKTNRVVTKKGSTKEEWRWALLNKNTNEQSKVYQLTTMPLSQSDIANSTKKHIFKY